MEARDGEGRDGGDTGTSAKLGAVVDAEGLEAGAAETGDSEGWDAGCLDIRQLCIILTSPALVLQVRRLHTAGTLTLTSHVHCMKLNRQRHSTCASRTMGPAAAAAARRRRGAPGVSLPVSSGP